MVVSRKRSRCAVGRVWVLVYLISARVYILFRLLRSSKGYPSSYATGSAIRDIDNFESSSETSLYHSGTELRRVEGVDLFHSSGGRVFTINARDSSFSSARGRVYEALSSINWRDGFYRRDIASEKDTQSFESCCAKVLRFA